MCSNLDFFLGFCCHRTLLWHHNLNQFWYINMLSFSLKTSQYLQEKGLLNGLWISLNGFWKRLVINIDLIMNFFFQAWRPCVRILWACKPNSDFPHRGLSYNFFITLRSLMLVASWKVKLSVYEYHQRCFKKTTVVVF